MIAKSSRYPKLETSARCRLYFLEVKIVNDRIMERVLYRDGSLGSI
jgi:hypothetical protein